MICCLILVISCLVIPAWAAVDVTGQGTFKSTDAKSVVAALFIALGVMPGEDATDFNTLVDECVAEVAPGGTVSMYVIPYSDTQVQTFVMAEDVESVRSWLFDNVLTVTDAAAGKAYYNGVELPALMVYDGRPLSFITYYEPSDDYNLFVFESFSSDSSKVRNYIVYECNSDSSSWSSVTSGTSTRYVGFSVFPLIWSNFDVYDSSGNLLMAASEPVSSSVSFKSDHSLVLGDIVGSDIPMPDGYSTWCGVPYTVDGITYYALQIGDSYDLTIQQDQSSSQSGISSGLIASTITGISIDVTPEVVDGPVDTFVPGGGDRDTFWFTVTVSGTGSFNNDFTYEFSEHRGDGYTEGGSFLTREGDGTGRTVRLTVGLLETAESLTVVFKSVQDPSVSISYTLTKEQTVSGEDQDNVYQEVLDNINNALSGLGSKLEDIFGGGSAGDDLTDKSGAISGDVSVMDDFEQSHMDSLDDSFAELKDKIDFAAFVPALTFIQKYLNSSFEGIQSFAIVFYLPLFLGLFFYMCSRIPGVTRFSAPSRYRGSSKRGSAISKKG